MEDKNIIKVHAKSNGAELNISAPSIKQAISATNNRAQYFAEQAKKYSDEAKSYRDNAKYYAEQNSDVSFEYIDNVKAGLEFQISQKQNKGDYALKNELPKKLSELDNDTEYVNKTEFNDAIDANSLPSQEGCEGKVLMSDGENESWVGINSFQLFDTKVSDKVLDFEESKGWAHQGTSVYKDALAGSRYGYPDFYAKCVEEFNDSNNSYEILRNNYTVVGSPTITEYGVASGFSWGNYVKVAKSLSFNNSWEIKQKIKLETPITSTNIFLDCIGDSTEIQIFILNNNNLACSIRVGGEYIATSGSGKASLTTGLDYICKLQFTGSSYIFSYSNNGVDFNKIWEVSSTLNVNLDTFNIGYSFNNGSNDLKHFSIEVDGEEVYRAVDYVATNPNGHKLYPISSKSLIDSIYEEQALAWLYGVDTENECIFLPRDKYFVNTNKYLYICVGNTTNYESVTDVVNQGMEILEQVNQGIESRVKVDGSNAEFPYIVETYQNGTSWYRVYSDGWCEQGGVSLSKTTITYLKPFANTNYDLLVSWYNGGAPNFPVVAQNLTETDFLITTSSGLTGNNALSWQACGYIV